MLWFLLKAVILLTVLVSLITYLLYWYEEGSRPYGPHPGVCTRAACIARGMGMSFLSQTIVFFTYPLALFNRAAIPRPGTLAGASRANPPILLVHGLYHNASAWVLYRKWLKEAGFTNVFCYSYFSFNTHFDALVDKLENRVAALEAACPGIKPVLLGHSLGGLVIRAWLARNGNQSRVLGVVTLGSPHQGSKLAGLGIGSLCRSIVFRSPLIRRIESEDVQPAIPCYSLSSALDNMVLPQEGLHIRNPAWREERTPLVSHIGMLYHRGTAMQAIAAIRAIVDEHAGQGDGLLHRDAEWEQKDTLEPESRA